MRDATRPLLSNQSARRLFLNRHGLGRDVWQGELDLLGLIERLGFVQVDSINTVERAHHMILGARTRKYRPKHLKQLLERDRSLFEHWTHDAAVIPIQFYPHWKMRFDRDRRALLRNWKNWRRDGFEERFTDVLAHIRENGPAMSREINPGETRSNGGWWDWHPSKTALEFLWRTGELAICRRDGFQKVFDLTERVVPETQRGLTPTDEETIDWACATALDRLGFATSGEIAAFWDKVTPAEANEWCQRQAAGTLIEIEIACADGSHRTHYARPWILADSESSPELPNRIRVLSPFDPALRNRNRAERLFGFHYRIEVFVPAAKRKYGYYVFPVLEGDRLIGRIDMKRAGPDGALSIAAFWPERSVKLGKGRLARLDGELHRLARFSGASCVMYQDNWHKTPL
ncbi:MAG: crosslink repair DNA glycosylase YcaQ family protein [Pseudomonadota bacterium]